MERTLLRSGFTTGTCAAAAAKAAAVFLLTGTAPERICIRTPKGTMADLLTIQSQETGYPGCFRVQKDAGDDPDVTHGSWVYAAVRQITGGQWEQLIKDGAGYIDHEYPGIYLTGGTGVGIVTRPGLQCPVGSYAINPVPRRMIIHAVSEVTRRYDPELLLEVKIAIPDGVRLAEQTFNPHLGIKGGISILGTSGVVEPMSEQALCETIRLDIRMKVLEGHYPIIVTPGNYGETFLRETLGIPLGEAVKCSNFIADTMEMLREERAESVLFVGHIGKLIKVSGGVRNTHSKYGDRRMELLADASGKILPALVPGILAANTTEEAIGLLVEAGAAIAVLNEVAGRIQLQVRDWIGEQPKIEVVTFSSAYGILGKTAGAGRQLEQKRGGQGQ
ncbi:MAG: cobalt-precorrin-5B (C(1))-methyltransferase CbiD [Lachnospiraceae bacterium]